VALTIGSCCDGKVQKPWEAKRSQVIRAADQRMIAPLSGAGDIGRPAGQQALTGRPAPAADSSRWFCTTEVPVRVLITVGCDARAPRPMRYDGGLPHCASDVGPIVHRAPRVTH